MGKKSKRQAAAAKATAPGAVLNSKAVCKAVDDLVSVTQGPSNEVLEALWRDFDAIQGALRVLREKQGPSHLKLKPRNEGLPVFEKWLKENGADYASVEIAEFPGLEYGLRATMDLQAEEKVLMIPQRLMMTSLTALNGPLGELVAKDRMLQAMPNVVLALHLLNEMFSPSSFWKPYIDVLPHSYSTPLFFSKQELQALQASPSLVKSLMQLRNITKLYAHLHRMIRTYTDASFPLHASGFLYDDFLWAVSCVMSRQNEIPIGEGHKGEVALAMIPLWDLANHCNGQMSTFFNLDNRTCDCFAAHFTRKGGEFRIFYGPRTNADLFVHQGFVYPPNESDTLQIKLGLSAKEDSKTKTLKTEILKRIELPISGTFFLHAMDCPFPPHLVAFVRVFTADQPQLEHYLSLNRLQLKHSLFSLKWRQADQRTLDFMEKRCSLLLRPYKTTLEEDEQLLMGGKLSPYAAIAVQLRICEKNILRHSEQFARRGLQSLASYAAANPAYHRAAPDELKLSWGRFASEGAVGVDQLLPKLEEIKECQTTLPSQQQNGEKGGGGGGAQAFNDSAVTQCEATGGESDCQEAVGREDSMGQQQEEEEEEEEDEEEQKEGEVLVRAVEEVGGEERDDREPKMGPSVPPLSVEELQVCQSSEVASDEPKPASMQSSLSSNEEGHTLIAQESGGGGGRSLNCAHHEPCTAESGGRGNSS